MKSGSNALNRRPDTNISPKRNLPGRAKTHMDARPSGFVEGFNNKIRVIQRRAYGLRDEEYLPAVKRGAVFFAPGRDIYPTRTSPIGSAMWR